MNYSCKKCGHQLFAVYYKKGMMIGLKNNLYCEQCKRLIDMTKNELEVMV